MTTRRLTLLALRPGAARLAPVCRIACLEWFLIGEASRQSRLQLRPLPMIDNSDLSLAYEPVIYLPTTQDAIAYTASSPNGRSRHRRAFLPSDSIGLRYAAMARPLAALAP
jgi:hypothetical protein